jgi:thiol-disulfide isomerase/thioredoxin
MSSDLTGPLADLEDDDFDSSGKPIGELLQKATGRPIFIMAQMSGCGHCVTAKPAFQNFCNKYKNKIFVATIHADGERTSEKNLAKRIGKFDKSFQGYPHYMLYINGQLVSGEPQGRSVEALEAFVSKYASL